MQTPEMLYMKLRALIINKFGNNNIRPKTRNEILNTNQSMYKLKTDLRIVVNYMWYSKWVHKIAVACVNGANAHIQHKPVSIQLKRNKL